MTALWFSRIKLKPDAHIQAIASLLLPTKPQREILATRHKLIWSLFADDKNRERDFLWREDKQGIFFTLSVRAPASDMFEIETKPYEPALAKGDSLSFSLRANPIVRRIKRDKTGAIITRETVSKVTGIKRTEPVRIKDDIVMSQLHDISKGPKRNEQRPVIIQDAGRNWLTGQGAKYGFTLDTVKSDSYHKHILPRKNGKKAGNISTLDLEGRLTITDPQQFLAKLATGFGSAKAFGCGLMLIRRA